MWKDLLCCLFYHSNGQWKKFKVKYQEAKILLETDVVQLTELSMS